jgi:hypothetical protein
LVRGGKVLWNLTSGFILKTLREHQLEDLIISSESHDIDLGDGIRPGEVIGGISMIPGLMKSDLYGGFGQMLRQSVGLRQGENFFPFAYDWRRDNRVSAKRLATFVDEKLANWRKASGNDAAKVILIGHSMGGLVSRYYIECLGGWQNVRRLFTLGTPHRGSLNALGFLANGLSKGIGPLHADATLPLRSFASVHQLLPTYPCIMQGGQHHRVSETEVPNLNRAMVEKAASFHSEIQDAIAQNRQLDGYRADYLSPVIGVRQPTFQSASLTSNGVELLTDMEGIELRDIGGDGTVPAPSALPVDLDAGVATHVWGAHSSLCKEESVREHMLAAVKFMGLDMDKFRSAPPRRGVSLWLDDAYEAGIAFPLIATVQGGVNEQQLVAHAETEDGSPGPSTVLHKDGESYVGELTIPEGAWRLRVSGNIVPGIEDVVLAA